MVYTYDKLNVYARTNTSCQKHFKAKFITNKMIKTAQEKNKKQNIYPQESIKT